MGHRELTWAILAGTTLALCGCGADVPAQRAQVGRRESAEKHRNFSTAWIYSVGEVDSVGAAECQKAFRVIDQERQCNGRACQLARDMARDYLEACVGADSNEQVSQIRELAIPLRERAAQPPYSCTDKPSHWISSGCERNSSCEADVQRWATRCASRIHSPLTVHILERVVENSLSDPHRVQLDVHGCEEFGKDLRLVENCDKAFDCQDALPKVDLFMQRCAEGKRQMVSLREAFSVARIQLVAEREYKPIALSSQVAQIETLPRIPILNDASGFAFKVCDAMVSSVSAYVDQRQKCEKGELVLLRAVKKETGNELDFVRVPHPSDPKFQAVFPALLVRGEVAEREKRGAEKLNDALASAKGASLANAFALVNQTYAMLPLTARRSDAVRKQFAAHDADLVAMLSEIGAAKARIAKTRTSELELIAFMRRSIRFPFADVGTDGVVQLSSSAELERIVAWFRTNRRLRCVYREDCQVRGRFDEVQAQGHGRLCTIRGCCQATDQSLCRQQATSCASQGEDGLLHRWTGSLCTR